MALNWTMLENGNPIPLPNERIVSKEHDIEITLKIPDAPPSGEAAAGGSGGAGKTLNAIGTVWVSNQRFIFVGPHPRPQPSIESLSIPHHLILSTKFEQPYFSANYLNLAIFPAPDGGLSPGTMVEVRFKDRGMFSWVEMLARTRSEALLKRREERLEEPLPLYVPPPGAAPPEVSERQVASGDDRPPDYF